MPPRPKRIENMAKNLTLAEIAVRTDAEASALPAREALAIVPPPYVAKGDGVALRYWSQVLDRLATAGVELLDDLDSETLGLYCSMLSRRDQTHKAFKRLAREAKKKNIDTSELLDLTKEMHTLDAQLRSQERLILQYADRLGLTPAGRAGLAKKRTAEAENDPDADLFG